MGGWQVRFGAIVSAWVLALVGISAPEALAAGPERRPWFHDTVEIGAAAVFSFVDTDIRIPPDLDLESDLNLDSFVVEPTAGVLWRFTENKRHRFQLDYFSVLRSGSETLDVPIDLPGLPPLDAGVRTKTDFDLHVLSLTYGYAFLQDERKELGIFGGLDFVFADTSIEAQVRGEPVKGSLVDDSFTTPFPTVGAFWSWAFAERFAFRSRFQVFGLEVGDVSGALFKGTFGIQHDTFEHVNFTLGYELLGATANIDGRLDDFSFFSHGPALGVVLRF